MSNAVKSKLNFSQAEQEQQAVIAAAQCLYIYHAGQYPTLSDVVEVLGIEREVLAPYQKKWDTLRQSHQTRLWSDFLRARKLLRERLDDLEWEGGSTDMILKLHAEFRSHLPLLDAVHIALVEFHDFLNLQDLSPEEVERFHQVLVDFEASFKVRILAGQTPLKGT